jgi:hypothetical protein
MDDKIEIPTPNLEKKFTVHNCKMKTTKHYRSNNRQNTLYRGVKFYKAHGAINYLGSRRTTKEYLHKHDNDSSNSNEISKNKKPITLIDETKKIIIRNSITNNSSNDQNAQEDQ